MAQLYPLLFFIICLFLFLSHSGTSWKIADTFYALLKKNSRFSAGNNAYCVEKSNTGGKPCFINPQNPRL